jgi:energy-coupling factor transport system ATP-binding protein
MKSLGLDAPQATELAHLLNLAQAAIHFPEDILTMDELITFLNQCPVAPKCHKAPQSAPIATPGADSHSAPNASAAVPLLELRGVSFIYNPGSAFEAKALDNINFSIYKGEFIGLIGHTGSGKSTLIQHLNSLLKPSSGTVLIDGLDMNADKKKLKSVRQRIGLVFQYPEHQLFEMTVLKDVSFGPQSLGLAPEEVEARAKAALEAVGIPPELYDKSPFDLSGGQKRRVAIAGALAMHPEALILDEPTAGLDPAGRDEILEQIRRMHDELKLTVILVSHSMEDVAKLASRVVVINRGHLMFTGEPAEVFSHVDELEHIGLAAPTAAYLMRGLKRDGWPVSERVYTLEAARDALLPILNGGGAQC